MAKLNVTVDNDLDDIKLEKRDEDKSKDKNKEKEDKKKAKKDKKKKKGGKSNFDKIVDEMELVTWPSKKDVVKYSIATIIMIVVLALFFVGISALFDLLYGLVRGWLN